MINRRSRCHGNTSVTAAWVISLPAWAQLQIFEPFLPPIMRDGLSGEADHLVLSVLAQRAGPPLINGICRQSAKAEIKYFCLNVTFVSFAGGEEAFVKIPRLRRRLHFLREHAGNDFLSRINALPV